MHEPPPLPPVPLLLPHRKNVLPATTVSGASFWGFDLDLAMNLDL